MNSAIRRLAFRFVAMAACFVGATASCAPAAPPPEPAPIAVPLQPAEVEALAALLEMEDRRDFDERLLREQTNAASPSVRRSAALSAGRLRDPAGVPLLTPLLSDADSAVAATAAFALGLIGDSTVVDELATLLYSPTRTVAAEAAWALGRIGGETGRAALLRFLETVGRAEGGQPAAESLRALVRFAPRVRPAIANPWFSADDPELRRAAAYALARRPNAAATSVLLSATSDTDAGVRSLAARGLTIELADSAGVPRAEVRAALLPLLDDVDQNVGVQAIRSLAGIGGSDVVGALTDRLQGTSPHVALTAAEALGRAAGGIEALADLTADTARPVALRGAALQSLARKAPVRAEAEALRWASSEDWLERAGAARALALVGSPTHAELRRLTRDDDGRVAAATLAAALDAAGDNLAPLRPLLTASLGSSDPWVRARALEGLADKRDAADLPLLLDAYERALHDPQPNAALAALDALARLQDSGVPATRGLFARFARPEDDRIRRRAREHFGEAAQTAWGHSPSVETDRSAEHYRAMIRDLVEPLSAGAPLPRAHIVTDAGEIEVELFTADAPVTVESFLRLAEAGYFDGQIWPRVVPNFVIQGGDPRGDGAGGPGYTLRDEINRHRFGRGMLGMAHSGPDTAGSQFFITHAPQPHLDGDYTVFGRVVRGMDVVDRVMVGERILSVVVDHETAGDG